jgi:2'-5' RNA ligase
MGEGKPVRLFVALDIPEEIRRRIDEFVRELRPRAPHARWVRVEGIHVTLKFIGEVPPERAERIRKALAPVRAAAPVAMAFRGAGFFPGEKHPRVFWVGIEASPVLAELAAEIERRLDPLGIAPETRAFHPHLTLARFERPADAGDLARAVAEGAGSDFGSTTERQFYLYQSKIARGGAQYTRLETFLFAPETP